MTVSQFLMALGWFMEGNIIQKFRRFLNNKPALVLCSVFVLHLIGLLYTSDFHYGLNDLRIKVPLLVLPIMFSSTDPLSAVRFRQVLLVFIFGVFASTMVSMYHYFGFSGIKINDIRDISRIISHIRLGLMVCFSIFILAYFITVNFPKVLNFRKVAYILLLLWFLIFLVILESATGIIICFTVSIIIIVRQTLKQGNRLLRYAYGFLLLAVLLSSTVYLYSVIKDYYKVIPVDLKHLETVSPRGSRYAHDTLNTMTENGNRIFIYLSYEELKKEWQKRSNVDFEGTDGKGDFLKFTLIRFLTSKGYRKDADGVAQLSAEEVKAVESGISNVKYINSFPITARFYEILWEFDSYVHGGNPSGHSATQRLEYWKAAIGIIKKHPVIGIGTGDVNTAFKDRYAEMHSPLYLNWQLRAHNQFLSIAVAFGICGLFVFLFSLYYPFVAKKFKPGFLYTVFFHHCIHVYAQ